jgi:WD40 repeat protein
MSSSGTGPGLLRRAGCGVALSPDERQIAATTMGGRSGGRSSGLLVGNLTVCDLPECTTQSRLLDNEKSTDRPNRYVYPESAAASVRFTPDGRSIVANVIGTSAHTDPEIRFHEFQPFARLMFFDAATRRLRRAVAMNGDEVPAMAVSDDGRLVGTAHDRFTARIWRADTGRLHRVMKSPEDRARAWHRDSSIHGVAFDAGGRRLATAGADGALTLWNVSTGAREHAVVLGEGGFGAVAFSPDGTLLVASECPSDFKVDLPASITAWDARTMRERWSIVTPSPCAARLAFDARGAWFAATAGTGVTFYGASTGARLLTLATMPNEDWLAWTPDGRYAGTPYGIDRLSGVREGIRAVPLSAIRPPMPLADLFAQALK